jgi:hypothetical protein
MRDRQRHARLKPKNQKGRLFRVLSVITLVGALTAGSFACAASSKPTAVTPDGGRYYGELLNGKLHGRGRLEWANGDHYEGTFVRGHFSGQRRKTSCSSS